MASCPFPPPATSGTPVRAVQTGRSDGHDRQARFTPSNRGGPDHPAARQTAAFRQALRAAVSADDVSAITRKLRELALGGNLSAIRLLLSYVVGRPGAADQEAMHDPPAAPAPDTLVVTEPAAPTPTPGTDPASADPPAAGNPNSENQKQTDPVTRGQTPRPPSATAQNGVALRRPLALEQERGEKVSGLAALSYPERDVRGMGRGESDKRRNTARPGAGPLPPPDFSFL